MKKKLIMVVLIVLIVTCLSGCYLINIIQLPTYERELNEQDGVAVTIDGVKYKALPELKWVGQRTGEVFGKADGKGLSLCKDDPDRNFIFIHDEEFQPLGELNNVLLYRTDREIPPPSADSVDEIYWSEINFRVDEPIRDSRWIYDKEIIEAIFKELNANQDTWVAETDSIAEYSMSVSCRSGLVPGAYYDLYFEHVNGKLVCGNYFEGFVEFSLDVLEEIAGHEIDLEELLAEY